MLARTSLVYFVLLQQSCAPYRIPVVAPLSSFCPTEPDTCRCSGSDISCVDRNLTRIPQFLAQPTADDFNNFSYSSIDLSGNRIQFVRSGAFRLAPAHRIKLWKNDLAVNLTFRRKSFAGLEHTLQSLSVRQNSIPKLPHGIFKSLVLRSIDLSDNRLESISRGLFRGTDSVDSLNLGDNHLESLGENVFFGLRKLKQIRLQRNRIAMVDSRAFVSLGELQFLDFRHNKIRDLQPQVFNRLHRLRILDLSNNAISGLFPMMFEGLTKLEKLMLSHNPILVIAKNTFSSLTTLSELRIEKTKITGLEPGAFFGLSNLRWLYLNNNHLWTLSDALFFNMTRLERLHMDNNELTSINVCAFDDVTKLAEISLTGNPIRCDCALAWASFTKTTVVHGKCAAPRVVQGQYIVEGDKYHVCRVTALDEDCRWKNDVVPNPNYSYFKYKFMYL